MIIVTIKPVAKQVAKIILVKLPFLLKLSLKIQVKAISEKTNGNNG
jgi:hypothetical protein